MVRCPKTKDLFILNHLEYDAITLKDEFLRDKSQNTQIDIPANYFPNDDINIEPINRWSLMRSYYLQFYKRSLSGCSIQLHEGSN